MDESILYPERYQQVNSFAVANLLSVCKKNDIQIFLQSSTAAVYGGSESRYVDESEKLEPISPYGQTKVEAEMHIKEYVQRGDLRACSLRFFNVIGSASRAMRDNSNANLVPKVLSAISQNQSPEIFGDDYSTPDGTCVLDYVHVEDVAIGHMLAIEKLMSDQIALAINIGTGHGYSVREMISEILRQTGSSLQPIIRDRRPGDPAFLVSRNELAIQELGFRTKKTLEEMIASSI